MSFNVAVAHMTKQITHTSLLFTLSSIYFHELQYLQYMQLYESVINNIAIMKLMWAAVIENFSSLSWSFWSWKIAFGNNFLIYKITSNSWKMF